MQAEGSFNFGLIGWPLGHSLSPRIHQAALRLTGLEGDYKLYPIPPGPQRKESFSTLLEKLRCGSVNGLNVTIPYKIEILDLVESLSPAAQAVGAANTLFLQDQRIMGDNTDAAGFVADLRELLPHLFSSSGEKTALVLGSGGAARAVVFALLQTGWRAVVASRSTERGQLLADHMDLPGKAYGVEVILLNAESLTRLIQNQNISLIVNATPAGMAPHVDQSPWPAGVPFPGKAAVYDLIYSPAETCLVKSARAAGLPAYTGLGMLVEQAACAFEIWTGIKPARAYLLENLKTEAALL
jgi:shikimate dehydrogenase